LRPRFEPVELRHGGSIVKGYLCRVETSSGQPGLGFGFDPITAQEMALADAEAREDGIPLCELFGGSPGVEVTSVLHVSSHDRHGVWNEAWGGAGAGYESLMVEAGSAVAPLSCAGPETLIVDGRGKDADRTVEEAKEICSDVVLLSDREVDTDVPLFVEVSSREELENVEEASGVALSVQRVGFLDSVLMGERARDMGFAVMVLTERESAVSVKAAAHLAGALEAEYADLSGHLGIVGDFEALGYAPEMELTGPGREVRVHHDPYELAEAP